MTRWINIVIILYCFLTIVGCTEKPESVDYTKYVDPFIGTQHEGHCFPGATTPMGMVQVSPESYNNYYKGYEMDHVTGYQFNDPWLIGFTQTHLNGVGCPSMSDILLMPFGKKDIDPSSRFNYRSTYQKENEIATPGYYQVYLDEHKVNVELTATEHSAYHRYTYDHVDSAKLLVDLQYGVSWDINSISSNVLEANQQFDDEYTLTGYRKGSVWAPRDLFYVMKFNKKITSKSILSAPENKEEKAPRYILGFDMEANNQLEVLIGVSTVGVKEAKENLEAEINSWNSFGKVRKQTNEKWNNILNKIEIKGRYTTAGFWDGVKFGSTNPNNKLEYVNIADGGNYWGYDYANIFLDGSLIVDNCTVSNANSWGLNISNSSMITSGGTVQSTPAGVEANNTFSANGSGPDANCTSGCGVNFE